MTEFNCLTLREYPQLNGLYLNNTEITKIKLPILPKLEEFEICCSKIEDLNWLTNNGANFPKLREFKANDCEIKRVGNIDQLKGLTELFLRGNPIKSVEGLISSQSFKNL